MKTAQYFIKKAQQAMLDSKRSAAAAAAAAVAVVAIAAVAAAAAAATAAAAAAQCSSCLLRGCRGLWVLLDGPAATAAAAAE